jgi:hypothetical protein
VAHRGRRRVDTTWSVERATPDISVLLRPSVRPVDPIGWEAADLSVQHETLARSGVAVVARLSVVNSPRADLFYRPYRSYPNGTACFAMRLPAAPIRHHQRAGRRAFGARHGGRATYAPLSSARRYPVVEPLNGTSREGGGTFPSVCSMSSASLYATVVATP